MEKEKQQRNNSVTVSNKDQIQSYIFTTAKYSFNVYEKRLLYRLVEMAQSEIEGLKFSQDCRKIEHNLWGSVLVTLPIASLLSGEDDKNYNKAKKALDSLSDKRFYYEDNRLWEKIYIIKSPKIQKYKNTMTFEIDPRIWGAILDFSKGYRKYELVTALNFKSVYSMRFYELISGQTNKITYSITFLKEMFQVTDKYKLNADFIRYVIEPARKELDESAPYSFEWSANKEGRKIVSINFYPIYKASKRDKDLEKKDLQKQTAISWDLARQVTDYLKKSIGFTAKEIRSNMDIFIAAQNTIPDILGNLAILKGKAHDKANPKGWIINALRGKINDIQGNAEQTDNDTKAAPPIESFADIIKRHKFD